MRYNAQQLLDRTRRRLGELAGSQQDQTWTDQYLLERIEDAHDDLVIAAVEAAQDYFTEVVQQNLVAGQDLYPVIDGFLRLRLMEREDSTTQEPRQYLYNPKREGVGQSQTTAVAENAGGYAFLSNDIELEERVEQTVGNGLVQHVVVEPPPPLLGLVESATASTLVLSAGGTESSPSEPPDEDDALNGTLVKIISGTGAGQKRRITDYTGAARSCTISPDWTQTPDDTSKYATVSKLPRKFHNLLVVGAALRARQDVDEDAGALVAEWNSGYDDFIAFVEERTYAQTAVPIFDVYDGL